MIVVWVAILVPAIWSLIVIPWDVVIIVRLLIIHKSLIFVGLLLRGVGFLVWGWNRLPFIVLVILTVWVKHQLRLKEGLLWCWGMED